METRKVTVFDAMTSSKVEFQSAAETFGALKSEIGSDVDFTDKKVTVRETRVTLEADEATLPDGDIVLFLFKQKSKFGMDDKKVVKLLRRIEKKIDDILDAIDASNDDIIDNEDAEDLSELIAEAEEIRNSLS